MDTVDLIYSYFPELTDLQKERFANLEALYRAWNEKINVISRKDIDNFWLHHVLHSLAIAKVLRFEPDTKIMDVGTGGGFPGIPLAILFPDSAFYLVDSIGKKVKVVEEVRKALGLDNVVAEQIRAESAKVQVDFVVSRAVGDFLPLVRSVRGKIRRDSRNALPNGIIYLKGGDFEEELESFRSEVKVWPIRDFFSEDFFETKKIVYLAYPVLS